MKTLLIFGMLVCVQVVVEARDVWKSTNSLTASTSVVPLCTNRQRGIFHGVCTSFGAANATMTVVSSTWVYSAVNASNWLAGPISTLAADQCKYYDITTSTAMGFFKNNTAAITILYDCY